MGVASEPLREKRFIRAEARYEHGGMVSGVPPYRVEWSDCGMLIILTRETSTGDEPPILINRFVWPEICQAVAALDAEATETARRNNAAASLLYDPEDD